MTAGSALHTHVLVVDDDVSVRSALKINLGRAGYDVILAPTAEEALARMHERAADIVLTDVKMPGMSGLGLLEELRPRWPDIPVVIMTGHGSVEDAVAAMKAGASNYIIKPVSKDELLVILARALREKALEAEVVTLRAALEDRFGFENLVGNTRAMREVYELVAAVAEADATVLITGPTGTGKELLSHAIHYRSRRREAPFVGVNCAALPEGLIESELFGHERGAFTGAVRQHRGKFEQADGGTLLLDEIGEIPHSVQLRLLRVIESGEFQRVGGRETLKIDVRLIAATNRDLREEVKSGRFREDLFYRLNVFQIPVPSLSQRRDDIPLLVDHFVTRYAERHRKPARRVTDAVLRTLMAHSWPGNVRELEHVIERAVILCHGEAITEVHLPEGEADNDDEAAVLASGATISDALSDLERRLIIEALRVEKGVQARAARRLGVSRSNLNYRIQKLDINVKDVVYE